MSTTALRRLVKLAGDNPRVTEDAMKELERIERACSLYVQGRAKDEAERLEMDATFVSVYEDAP